MIVRSLEEIQNTGRNVSGPGWKSRRLLIASEGMGYSLTNTVILEEASLTLEYKHYFEACYCIEGEGDVTAFNDRVTHKLQPFTMYALDQNDRHTVPCNQW